MTHRLTTTCLLLAGTLAACAAEARPAYDGFRPAEADLARLANPAFTRCVDQASAPYKLNTQTIQGCYDAETARLDSLLAAARTRAGTSDEATGDAAHEAWRQAARDGCAASNPQHPGWGWAFDLQSCELDETKRRILWLEAAAQ